MRTAVIAVLLASMVSTAQAEMREVRLVGGTTSPGLGLDFSSRRFHLFGDINTDNQSQLGFGYIVYKGKPKPNAQPGQMGVTGFTSGVIPEAVFQSDYLGVPSRTIAQVRSTWVEDSRKPFALRGGMLFSLETTEGLVFSPTGQTRVLIVSRIMMTDGETPSRTVGIEDYREFVHGVSAFDFPSDQQRRDPRYRERPHIRVIAASKRAFITNKVPGLPLLGRFSINTHIDNVDAALLLENPGKAVGTEFRLELIYRRYR